MMGYRYLIVKIGWIYWPKYFVINKKIYQLVRLDIKTDIYSRILTVLLCPYFLQSVSSTQNAAAHNKQKTIKKIKIKNIVSIDCQVIRILMNFYKMWLRYYLKSHTKKSIWNYKVKSSTSTNPIPSNPIHIP